MSIPGKVYHKVYLDTNVFIYFLDRNPDYFRLVAPVIEAVEAGLINALGKRTPDETVYRNTQHITISPPPPSHIKRRAINFEPGDLLLILRIIPVNLIPELRIVPFVFEVTQLMDNQVVDDACGSHHDLQVKIDFPLFIRAGGPSALQFQH